MIDPIGAIGVAADSWNIPSSFTTTERMLRRRQKASISKYRPSRLPYHMLVLLSRSTSRLHLIAIKIPRLLKTFIGDTNPRICSSGAINFPVKPRFQNKQFKFRSFSLINNGQGGGIETSIHQLFTDQCDGIQCDFHGSSDIYR